MGWGGGLCDYCVSPSPFGLDLCYSVSISYLASIKNFIPIEIGPIPYCFVSAALYEGFSLILKYVHLPA